MKYEIPTRISQMTPYDPVQGDYSIRLDANESYMDLTAEQKKQIALKIEDIKFNRYPDPTAKKVCQLFADMYGVNKDNIIAGNGSDELIGLLASAFFGSSDKVAVFENDFSMYKVYMEIYGVNCVTLPKNEDLTIDIDKAIQAINDGGISAVIFSNPCNPTSLGMSKSDVIKLIKNTEALIILDEAYMDFYNQSLLKEHENYSNLLILKTCSKAIGLAGIRLGFAIGSKEMITAMKASKAPYNLDSTTQAIGEIALSNPKYLKECANKLTDLTKTLQADIMRITKNIDIIEKVYNSDTNFVFIKCQKGEEIYKELQKRSISIRFMGKYLRISTGSAEENAQFIEQFSQVLKEI